MVTRVEFYSEEKRRKAVAEHYRRVTMDNAPACLTRDKFIREIEKLGATNKRHHENYIVDFDDNGDGIEKTCDLYNLDFPCFVFTVAVPFDNTCHIYYAGKFGHDFTDSSCEYDYRYALNRLASVSHLCEPKYYWYDIEDPIYGRMGCEPIEVMRWNCHNSEHICRWLFPTEDIKRPFEKCKETFGKNNFAVRYQDGTVTFCEEIRGEATRDDGLGWWDL